MAPNPIRADVLEALADWKSGKSVRSVELGHAHRMKEVPGFSPKIDESQYLHRDQERAHDFCFAILASFFKEGAPESHEEFLVLAEEIARNFPGLTAEEREGAESLAWKALLVGWQRAIAGHEFYIQVAKSGVEAT